jgi:hypothetical protein
MLSIFKKKPLLSEVDRAFQHACYAWLLKHFGGDDFYKEAQLVLPTEDFFPTQIESPTEAAQVTFEQVKKFAGMEKWPCTLVAQEEDPNLVVAPTLIVQNAEHNPSGTFVANENNEVTITYNPRLTANPVQMVATFAHELSHYLTATAAEPPPGGWDNWEFATDICASFLGFGIFVANSAFSFNQHTSVDSQGWQSSRSGYLTEAEHSYALALFLVLKDIPFEVALEHCDANIKSNLKRAQQELEGNSIIEELRNVEYRKTHS